MIKIPSPIFEKNLEKIKWIKIYSREYGVGYSEMAILCLSPKARHHIPKSSVSHIVIPEENNTAFYIDEKTWAEVVSSLNDKYTSHTEKLEYYEKEFLKDGSLYLETSRKISRTPLSKLSSAQLKKIYLDYQEKLFRYSIFAWTAFILNNFISGKAKSVLDRYIKDKHKEKDTVDIFNSLFKPEKLAAVLQLQYEVGKNKGKLTPYKFNQLYQSYKWLSCLDIHNLPWTIKEFRRHISAFDSVAKTHEKPFTRYTEILDIKRKDLDYLLMAKRFVYIKDARDDFRRQGVYFASSLFRVMAKRMGITLNDISYLTQDEISGFLEGKKEISQTIISDRKKGFVLYLDNKGKLTCLTSADARKALTDFRISTRKEKERAIKGMVACKGSLIGKVVIVKGVKDLSKVKKGNILVAVTTHPDYVSAMRIAAAIVTDEGGITSHAAIVSREFGIPCIVGTKNATSVFKDGDTVEVNGENGTIKMI